MSTRCAITDLLTDQCAHCRKLPDPEAVDKPKPTVRGRKFSARFPGKCGECQEYYPRGTTIREYEEIGYVAECCLTE